MSVTSVLARGMAATAATATCLAVLAGTGLPSAQAAAARPAGLHVSGSVNLGKLSTSFADDFSEAPSGAVYYSNGHSVYVVKGTSRSKVRSVSGTVLAVAASSSDLFVLVGRTVTEYGISGGGARRHWRLSGPAPTSGGLYVAGSKVWAWTDPATDESGFQYATVFRFTTSSGAVHRVSANEVYPGDMAASSAGLYYEAVTGDGAHDNLVHLAPSGSTHSVHDAYLDAPLALSGGRVDLLAEHDTGSHQGTYLDVYNQSSLAHVHSFHVSGSDRDIAGTGAGLLVLSSAKVKVLSSSTGRTGSSVSVGGAFTLVSGHSAVVISFRSSDHDYYLNRLSA